MKYVVFRKPDIHLDGLDWVYNLTEDRADRQGYDFFLIETKSFIDVSIVPSGSLNDIAVPLGPFIIIPSIRA